MENFDEIIQRKACRCGRKHTAGVDDIVIGDNALDVLVDFVDKRRVFMVCDDNTYKAVGYKCEELFIAGNIEYDKIILTGKVHSDEYNIGSVLLNAEPIPQLFVAVGSGSINDLTRFCAHRLGVPYGIVATAPSMDGYASDVCPISINGLKITYPTTMPKFILTSKEILDAAPTQLKSWGLGDMIGKRVALLDWQLARKLTGEYFCQTIHDTMDEALGMCISSIGSDGENTILINGLILAGLSMQMAGNSRPASGAEHHLSHYLEMKDIVNGRKGVSHGIKVGMATPIMLMIYKKFFDRLPRPKPVKPYAEWLNDVKAGYGDLADIIIKNNSAYYETDDFAGKVYENLLENKDFFITKLKTKEMQPKRIVGIMASIGVDIHPKAIGYNKSDIYEGLINCVEIRPRFTILRLLKCFGVLEEYVKEVVDELYE